MNARELMIGDLVMAHYNDGETQCEFPAVVIAVFTDRLLCNDGIQIKSISSEYSGCEEECINIEPIQITHEILEKNLKFVTANQYRVVFRLYITENDCIQYTKYTTESERSNELMVYINGSAVSVHVRYVHELQHVLRVCGLNDFADNFKI